MGNGKLTSKALKLMHRKEQKNKLEYNPNDADAM